MNEYLNQIKIITTRERLTIGPANKPGDPLSKRVHFLKDSVVDGQLHCLGMNKAYNSVLTLVFNFNTALASASFEGKRFYATQNKRPCKDYQANLTIINRK